MKTTILLRILGAASSLTLACCTTPLTPYENSQEAAERRGDGYSLDTPARGTRYMAGPETGTRLESTEVTTTETTRVESAPVTPPPPTTTSTTTTTVTPSAPASAPTYGTPVPGRRGFVYPPGVDTKPENMVDVRDFQPGQKVRDPRTGKIFLVP